MTAPAALERGPFSYDKYTLDETTSADNVSGRTFDLSTRTRIDPDINEILEVYVEGVKLKGSGGTTTTGGGDEFFVNSLTAPTTLTIVPNDTLLALTSSAGNGSTIESLSDGDFLVIKRVSNRSSKNVDYAPGSVIREVDLDSSNTQIIHVAQEAIDIAVGSMVLDTDDKWDAQSKKIKSVLDGVADNDAVNVSQLETHDTTITGYRDTTLAYREDTEDYKLETADWATKVNGAVNTYVDNTAQTDGSAFSAKAHAIGGTGVDNATGSAKDWAMEINGTPSSTAAEASAREWAIGTSTHKPDGSAKTWASETGAGESGHITGGASGDKSAKSWASETGANAPSDGSSKEWATNAGSAEVATSAGYSSKAYAQDTGNNIGSSKDWAVLATQVTSADYSSKQYAVGTPPDGSAKEWAKDTGGVVAASEWSAKNWATGTHASNAPSDGSAKEWSIGGEGTMATTPNGSEFSAKEYSQGVTATGGTSKQWSLGGGSHAVGTAVTGTSYASKAYSQSTTAGTDTYGGSAKGWASTAYDTQVPGASSANRSALHYSTDASNSALAAKNSANAVANTFDAFDDTYLGTMSNTSAQGTNPTTNGTWAKDSSAITVVSGTNIKVGQVVTGFTSSHLPSPAPPPNVISVSGTAVVVSENLSALGSAVALTFTGYGVYGTYNGTKDGPTTDNDNGALANGMLYFNSTDNNMMVYKETGAAWIAATSSGGVSLVMHKAVASGTPTSFAASDFTPTLSYEVNNIVVWLNGVKLDATDYTATTGTTITGLSALANLDEMVVLAFKTFEVGDAVSQASGGTFSGAVTFGAGLVANTADINGGTLGGITIDGNWTAASQTCADLGTVTTADINGGTIDGCTITGNISGNAGGTAATVTGGTQSAITTATNLTSVGTLTSFRSTGIDDNASGATAITINASEQVGVGNAVPHRVLDVMSNAAGITFPLRVYNDTADGAGEGVGIQFGCDYYGADGVGDQGKGALIYEPSTSYARGKFHFLQNSDADRDGPVIGDAVMTIDNSGNIGIGTAAPDKQLELAHATDPVMRFTRADSAIVDTENLGSIHFSGDDPDGSTGAIIQARAEGTWGTNDLPSALLFYTCPDGSGDVVERMRINSSGTTETSAGHVGTVLLASCPAFNSGWSHYASSALPASPTDSFTSVASGSNTPAGGPYYPAGWTYVNGKTYQVHITGNSSHGVSIYTGWSPSQHVYNINIGDFDETFEISPMTETTQGGFFFRHGLENTGGVDKVTRIDSLTIKEVTGGNLIVNNARLGIGSFGVKGSTPDCALHIKSPGSTSEFGMITDMSGMDAAATSIFFHAFRQNGTSVGYLWNNSGSTFEVVSESDEKLKKNIRDAEYGLDEVLSLRPVSFDWKEPIPEDRPEVKDNPVEVVERKNIKGFIAQEVEKVVPEAVGDSPEGNKVMSVTSLIPILTKAIQELSAKVTTLENA